VPFGCWPIDWRRQWHKRVEEWHSQPGTTSVIRELDKLLGGFTIGTKNIAKAHKGEMNIST
jgi:hypothetical protein